MRRTDEELHRIALTSQNMREANQAAMELLRRRDTLLPHPRLPLWRRVLNRFLP